MTYLEVIVWITNAVSAAFIIYTSVCVYKEVREYGKESIHWDRLITLFISLIFINIVLYSAT